MVSNSTLFIGADYEAIKFSEKISRTEIQNIMNTHFVYSCLLSDKVILPVGCYFESLYVQQLVETYHGLFLPYNDKCAIAGLGLGDDRDSYEDDIRIKASWFPEEYNLSDFSRNAELIGNISDIEPTIRAGKMRKKLTSYISNDISPRGGLSFQALTQEFPEEKTTEIVDPLQIVISDQKYALLPPYIRMEIEKQKKGEVQDQALWLDFILFKNYVLSCADAYDAYCNNPFSLFYKSIFKKIYSFNLDYRDTMLFKCFLSEFPLKELSSPTRLPPNEIFRIKESFEFKKYLYCYKVAVKILKDNLSLYVANQEYSLVSHSFQDELQNEKKLYRNFIASNALEAEMLYRAFRKSIFKSKRKKFNQWFSNRADDFPLLSVLSEIEDRDDGILKCYIDELACSVETRHKQLKWQFKNRPSSNINTERKYAIALSFAGEERNFVNQVADLLCYEFGRKNVFYDDSHKLELARPDLEGHLRNLYLFESELVVIFCSEEYFKKEWCSIEWSAIQRRISINSNSDWILLFRLDSVDVDDHLKEFGSEAFKGKSGYIDINTANCSAQSVAETIINRYYLSKGGA